MSFPLRRFKGALHLDAPDSGFSYTERTPIRTGRRAPGALVVLMVVVMVVILVALAL